MLEKWSFLACLTAVIQSLVHFTSGTCTFNNYNFGPISSHSWIAQEFNNTNTYTISICDPLTGLGQPCDAYASVCKYSSTDKKYQLLGNKTEINKDYIVEDSSKKELRLTLKGAPCTKVEHDFLKTIIILKCGRTLGSPVYIDEYACDTYFEWFTSVACKPDEGDPDPPPEVPCYTYDKHGKKRDLSPLIKTSGAYFVGSTSEDTSFYINVCRGITTDPLVKSECAGSAACVIKNNAPQHAGDPISALQLNKDGELYIVYTREEITPGCSEKTVTIVTFRCPARGLSKDPLLLSAEDCNYSILWETEYACPEESLISKTCKLTYEQHGLNIDLTPLINTDPNNRYIAEGKNSDGSKTYQYFLNVCEDVGVECPDKKEGVIACQLNGNEGRILGRTDHQKLRYSDRELTLIYSDGDACHTNFHRTTVIQFHCNQTASNDGKGKPTFNTESNCTYIFDWDTKYACVDTEENVKCSVSVGKQEYDLSILLRTTGSGNWESLNAKDDKSKERFYLNVCGKVVKSGNATLCPTESAACYRTSNGDYKNIGSYKQSPTYDTDTKSLELRYIGGDSCDNGQKKKETVIKFTCKPGDLEGGPVLTSVSSDQCVYEFEWHTAGACVLSQATGADCKVFDQELGFSFDLSPLKKTGDNAYYKVPSASTEHDYYINVCDKVTGLSGSCATAGACQERKDHHGNYNTGEPNGELRYYNGLINLVYHGGDPYQTSPPIPRQTELAFLCDPAAGDAGVGQPEFLAETNHTYSFRWFTKYACPQVPVECVLIDDKTNNQYDISKLTKGESEGNWEAMESGGKKQFYINVCRPVNPVTVGSGCDSTAGVCATLTENGQTTLFSSNLGEPRSPKLQSDGRILLEYRNGKVCTKQEGTKSTYSTKIFLQCKKGENNARPLPAGVEEECVFTFTWDTEAACPVTQGESEEGEDCTVKDPNFDFTYNLQHLRKSGSGNTDYYSVTAPNGSKEYKVNVCGSVVDCGGSDTAACLGDQSLGKVSKKLEISDTGVISLTYEGSRTQQGSLVKAVITFDCDRKAYDGQLIFDRIDQDTHRFILKTTAACSPEPVECQVTDAEGNEYDLSSLRKDSGSWEVPDSRPGYEHLRYYINVCKPITITEATKSCPSGPIGGCQVDTRPDGSSHSMGYDQGELLAVKDAITIRYLGGEICHKGTPQESYRSTRINFHCSDVEGDPVMVSETAGCEYVIEWNTPAACPIKTSLGSGCKVTESLYHHTFDLSGIQRADSNYEVDTGGYKFLLNVCGPLHDGPGECAGKGSCQTKPSDSSFSPVNAGIGNDKLIYEDGVIMLNYTGGRGCHGNKYNRSTVIEFTCDHKTVTSGPLNYTENSECTYHFQWPTSLACMPVTMGDCRLVKSKGEIIDLSSLTRTSDNYHVQSSESGKKFVLNMCTTLVHQKGTTCPPGAAACMVDTTDPNKKKYISLGKIHVDHIVDEEQGHVTVTYDNGDDCPTDSSKKIKTVIQLLCPQDRTTGIDTEPQFMYTSNCEYHFTWTTLAACTDGGMQSGSDCKVTNPNTGYEYNLASLAKPEGIKVDDGKGKIFEINVCGKLDQTTCTGTNVGSCQVEKEGSRRNFTAGLANSNLEYITMGVLHLNYTGGQLCHHNNQKRNTIISFVCADTEGGPVVLGESDCTYHITWQTKLACEKQVACSVERGDQKYDLSPLVDGFHPAEVADALDPEVSQSSYFLAVCRPLPPVQGRLCPPEAAVCREDAQQNTQSLGQAVNPPFIDEKTNKVTLLYEHGYKCEGGKTWTSRIEFICKRGSEQGSPVLMTVNKASCEYVFEWETYLVCDESGPVTTSDCKYTDGRTKTTYDLSGLTSQGPYSVFSNKDRTIQYKVTPCTSISDGSSECNGASVCMIKGEKHTNFGSVSKVQFVSEGQNFKMLRTGDLCESLGSQRQSVIIFHCDRSKTNSKPLLFDEGDCIVVFTWSTALACPPDTQECVYTRDGATYDLSRLSMESKNWEMKDTQGNTYYLNLCEAVHGAPPGCPSNAAVCRKTTNGVVEMLGTVDSQEMTFEEGHLVVKYSEGTMACSKRRRRSENASVKITLVCGKGVQGPHVTRTDTSGDNCLFEFLWTTSLACKEERRRVDINNNKIVDPMSHGSINVKDIFYDKQHTIQTVDYKYLMNLGKAISDPGCGNDAAVCQMSTSAVQNKINIAETDTRTLYIEDGTLEVVYTSHESCTPSSTMKTPVTTIVDISCTDEANKSPVFFYKSKNCHYVFQWETPSACFYQSGKPGTVNASVQDTSPKTIGIVVAVFLSTAILCVLAIVFHKAERREACAYRLRNLFGRRRSGYTYSYSQLSAGEATLDTLLSESNTSPGRYGSDVTDTSNFQLLNDDSDEDDDVLLGL